MRRRSRHTMHSRSARDSTRTSKALARLNWTVGVVAGSGTVPHCTGAGTPPVTGPVRAARAEWGQAPRPGQPAWAARLGHPPRHRQRSRRGRPQSRHRRGSHHHRGSDRRADRCGHLRSAAAFEEWRAVAPGDRARLLRRFAAAVDADIVQLAALEVINAGHVLGNARWEAGNVRDVIEFYAGAPERRSGRQIPVPGGLDVTFHEPLGVVGIIVPWNFPMAIAGWGFAPALAAGNTVVLKPAELTPLSTLRIGELALEAGIPEGVLQILPGKGSLVGQQFVDHPAVRKVCFTGSTEVGRQVMAGSAQIKRVTLELGGKSANIVFADADIELAAARAPYGVFDNAGQDCCARSRILVQRSAYERFMELLEPAVAGIRVGDPTLEETDMGPPSPRPTWPPWRRSCPTMRRWPSGAAARTAPATGSPRPCWRRSTRLGRRRPRRLRTGGRGDPLRGRGRHGPSGQRHAVWAVRVAGPATSAGLSASPTPSRPGRSRSTPIRQCATGRPSVAPSSPASGASSVPTRWSRSATSRTSSSARTSGPAPIRQEERHERRHHPVRPPPRRPRGGRHRWRQRHRPAPCASASPARAPPSSWSISTRRPGARWPRAVDGMFVKADVTSSDEVEALYAEVAGRYGGIDICCNNAGVSRPDDDSILDTGLDAWDRVQRVNLTSVYLCCRHTLPHLLARGKGSIINTASFVAVMGAATSQVSYTASKGGVLAMSRELGVQFARQGVRVNALCPGPVNTPAAAGAVRQGSRAAARRLVHIPMGRFGEATEIAAATAFLASDDSSFMTASTYPSSTSGGLRGLRHTL